MHLHAAVNRGLPALLVAGLALGCSSEKREFLRAEAALSAGDLAVADSQYSAFVSKYPDSKRRLVVERQRDKLRFVRVFRDSSSRARAEGLFTEALRHEERILAEHPTLGDTVAVAVLRKAVDSARAISNANADARLAEIDSRMRFLGFYLGMPVRRALERAQQMNERQRESDRGFDECYAKFWDSPRTIGRCEYTIKSVTLGSYESIDITLEFEGGSVSGLLFQGYSTVYNLSSLISSFRNRLGREGRTEEAEVAGVRVAQNCFTSDVSDLRCSATRWTGRNHESLLIAKVGTRSDGDPHTSMSLLIVPRGRR